MINLFNTVQKYFLINIIKAFKQNKKITNVNTLSKHVPTQVLGLITDPRIKWLKNDLLTLNGGKALTQGDDNNDL